MLLLQAVTKSKLTVNVQQHECEVTIIGIKCVKKVEGVESVEG